ncbi:MAG: 50S ribosomal protein L20 [Legionellales bacterium]|jgi:large subunit ribosomal protein L20|nr:50S ribosomal protein L20 [Legionellales bacterium]|tara:strand:- start:269 stop:625 length:357 start_codon:yes stop_codon:yes gene_type:complete
MTRARTGVVSKRSHKKILSQAKGYYGARRKVFRVAKQAVIKAGQYAYRDRRQRKRQFRALWVVRINAAVRQFGLSYSRFIHLLNESGITINRKCLSNMAIEDKPGFAKLVERINKKAA